MNLPLLSFSVIGEYEPQADSEEDLTDRNIGRPVRHPTDTPPLNTHLSILKAISRTDLSCRNI